MSDVPVIPGDSEHPYGRGIEEFKVVCCGKRRGMLPGVILLCSKCDYVGEKGVPEDRAKDAPKHLTTVRIPRVKPPRPNTYLMGEPGPEVEK